MAPENQHFCHNYLLLKAEEASLLDLFWVLISSHELERRRFIECPEGFKDRDFRRRWIIFISVLMQKLLLLWRVPLGQVGHALELWLNLLSCNGGFFLLLFNLFTGKVVRPDRSSAAYTSVLENLDSRVELDKSIRCGSTIYNASLSMMAAKLSYENEALIKTIVTNHWKMVFLGFYQFWNDYQQRFSTQAFMLQDSTADPTLILVSFRGTHPFDADAWRTDFDISWYELPNVGKIHSGFMKALGLQRDKGWPKEIGPSSDQHPFAYYTIREKLREILSKNERAKFIVTGHSLGGALAILFLGVLSLHEETWLMERLEGVYTFGQPRVGDKQFAEFMKEKLRMFDLRYLRYVYCNDMVPRLPYDDKTLLFKHFGTCLYYNSCYKGKVVWEEPNKNYFSLLWAIPKNINAVWEMIRGLIIPYTKGGEYREGWILKVFRVIGLAIPGLPAHFPQDYVNITRLGSLPLPPRLQDQTTHQHYLKHN